ncbi:translocation/assembly module TamB domain-containing protein [Shewanella sp. SR44-3]|uniref:translocation/assembly module TamB domain-containing protein n=1 Tax=Shewanella sp. SR44-3 TaxID=2760936 RepID=UPI0015FB98BF|nr:translocation/assembly module TamB domain-containing protein [Shewanella sp. SR44-3]MBB1270583.1 translocation/assembly module TamB domain-containing protein [Shewanella sp. SR44-3]
MKHNLPDEANAAPLAINQASSKTLAKLLTWLKHSLRLSLYLPLALLMLLALMLGTPMGSQGAIILANKLLPGLELEYQSGTLNREISLSQLHYRLDGLSVTANEVTLSWQPSCLLNLQFCIQSLSAEAVSIDYHDLPNADLENANPPTDKTTELANAASASFEIPMAILLSRAKLKNLDVNIHDMNYQADELSANAIWNSSGLTVRTLNSQGLKVIIPQNNSVEPSPAFERVEDLGQLAFTDLPQVTLPFPIRVKNLTATDSLLTLGERQDSFPHIELKASMKDSMLRVSALQLTHSDSSELLSGQVASGQLNLNGQLNFSGNYPLEITADLQLAHLTELPGLADQRISLELSQDFSNLKLRAQGQGQSQFLLDANLALTTNTLNYQLSLSDSQLHWPLGGKQFQANIATLVSTGNIHSQQLSLKADITSMIGGSITAVNHDATAALATHSNSTKNSTQDSKALVPQQINIKLDTQLKHQGQKLIIEQLAMSSSAGQLTATAELSYDDSVQWHAKLETQGLQLQQLLPLFTQQPLSGNTEQSVDAQLDNFGLISSNISGNFATQGKLSANAWQLAITQANLSGSVNGYPLTVSGDISADSHLNLTANQLEAQALGARLSVHGEAKERWDVNAKLSVPDVSQWFNRGRGSIIATANIDGLQANPLLTVQTELNDFSANGVNLDYVQLIGSYAPKLKHKFTLQLRNNLLKWKKHQVTDLILNAKGDNKKQSVTLITGGDIAINGELTSQYQQLSNAMTAKLAHFNITTKLGKWALDKPAQIRWQQGKGNISPLCLVHPHSQLCLVDPIEIGKQGQVNLSFKGNPGQLLTPILSKKMRWDGDAKLTAQVHWREGMRPTAKLDFALLPGNITLIRAKNNRISLDYQQLSLTAQLNEQALSSQLSINSKGIAQLQSQFTIANNQQRSLSGNLDVSHLNLQPFGEFFPQIATLEGIVSSKLLLAGTLTEPDISGHIRLNDGAVSVTSNPTLLDKIYLDLALAGQQGSLTGHWFMGKGEGKVLGTLVWPQGQFSGDLAITGDSLAFIQPPLAILDVSPTLALSFNRQQLTVTGDIDVPSGQIKIVPLAQGGIPVSDDVAFNDSISAQEVKTSPYAIVADLSINVGKELLIDGLGLTGKLGGKLLLKQQAFKPPLLYGDIKVSQGSYRFMGQSLKISTGEVQFVGPAENPNLNIQAVREIKDEDLTAGVRITGTPARPVVTLFSTPAKEQAEILSYILKGTGFSSTNNQQNNSLMMSAALSLSSQFDGGAINSIGNTASGLIEKFGFSNVQLDANDEGRVALSGYIGEDLMVKYGMGVFNPGYEMTVRYYLLSQLYLETVSGTLSQSLDLYYSFDID